MYRIHFAPRLGRFVVQVLAFGIFWRTVVNGDTIQSFESFTEATNYVTSIGLDKLYKNYSEDAYRAHMRGQTGYPA